MGSQSDRFRTVFHARWFNADSFIESGKQLGCQSVFPDCVENLQKIGILLTMHLLEFYGHIGKFAQSF